MAENNHSGEGRQHSPVWQGQVSGGLREISKVNSEESEGKRGDPHDGNSMSRGGPSSEHRGVRTARDDWLEGGVCLAKME